MSLFLRGCKKEEKSGEAARYFFRFLFGFQKGSRVWGKAPLLPLKSRENKLLIWRVKSDVRSGRSRRFGNKEKE